MFRTIKGRIVTFCIFLILSIGVAFYIQEKNKPAPEPIKIYKVTTPYPKRVPPAKSGSVKAVPTKAPPVENPHAGHNHPPSNHNHDAETLPTETFAVDTIDTDVPTLTESQSLSDAEIDEWVTSIMETLEALDRKFAEKYPELLEISTMTKEDFFEAYPTHESQQALLERVQRAQPEMFAEISAVFSQIPREIVEDILSEAKAYFIQQWGTETAEQVMSQLHRELGL
ncbi:hypothetical protein C6503_16935 [Candidatus Poribacteria bacterium]|nr:MAG: hypothetical protein C6503_16935 [Candidatus Poribacteria bacterium]